MTFEPFWAISVPIPTKNGGVGVGGYRSRFSGGGSSSDDAVANIKLRDCLDLFVKGKPLSKEVAYLSSAKAD